MSGSRRNFRYVTDSGDSFVINLDESNTEALNGGEANVPGVAFRPKYFLPKGIKPRTLTYATSDGLRRIKCVALTPLIFTEADTNFTSITDPIGGGTLFLEGGDAEKRKKIRWSDTGQLDGDVES